MTDWRDPDADALVWAEGFIASLESEAHEALQVGGYLPTDDDSEHEVPLGRLRALAAALRREQEKSADLGSVINTLCVPPGVTDTPRERADYTLACLREAVAERDALRERLSVREEQITDALDAHGAPFGEDDIIDRIRAWEQRERNTRERLRARPGSEAPESAVSVVADWGNEDITVSWWTAGDAWRDDAGVREGNPVRWWPLPGDET